MGDFGKKYNEWVEKEYHLLHSELAHVEEEDEIVMEQLGVCIVH